MHLTGQPMSKMSHGRQRAPGASLISILMFAASTATLAIPGASAGSELARVDSLYSEAEDAYSAGDFEEAADAYRAASALAASAGDSAKTYMKERRRRADFMLARALERDCRWSEAGAAYEALLEEMPIVADALRLRIAVCQREDDEFDGAILNLRAVIDAPERTTLYLTAVEQLADTHRDAGDYDVALQWYRVLLKESSGYDDRARVRLKMGRTFVDRRDEDLAADSFAEVLREFPRSPYAYEALSEGRRISRAFTDRYHQGLVLYNRGRYRQAAEFFTFYLRHEPEGEYRSQASYFRGRSHQRMGSYGSAADDYRDVLEHGSRVEYFDLAWSRLAYCIRASGRVEESLARYAEYADLYPDREAAPDMLWERGRLLEEELRWDEAVAAFDELAERYPGSSRARESQFRAGLCLYKLGRYADAESAFADVPAADGQAGAARSLFWAGKCSESAGDSEAAAARYEEAVYASPDTYYGRRAAWRLRALEALSPFGDAHGRPVAKNVADVAAPGAGTQLAFPFRRISGLQDFAAWLAEWYHLVYLPGERIELTRLLRSEPAFKRADAFMALHMTTEAERELGLLEDMYGSDPRMLDILIGYYEGIGLRKRAIRMAEWILELSPAETQSDAPPYLRRKICPRHFDGTVLTECDANGIDPALFYSLIRQESLFEPGAVSWVGARGLSQIMPHTGRWIARRLGMRGFRTSHLLDPELNVRFGTYYLAEQLEEFDGDVMRALAAYNGGPHNVDRWWNYGGGKDTDVFVEDIGYSQTNDYVRRVFLYCEFYRELWAGL